MREYEQISSLVKPQERPIYAVIYRTGGTKACEWRKMIGLFTIGEARQHQDELEKAGYKTIRRTYDELQKVGLPIGWEYNSVDWENDTIEVHADKTVWHSAEIKRLD